MCPSACGPPHPCGYTAMVVCSRGEIHMPRRRLYLAALIVEAVLVGCAAAVLAVSEKAEAAFSGENGHIAYVRNDGQDHEIYAINGGGGGDIQLTDNATDDYSPSYSPDGKKIVYMHDGTDDSELYTIDVRTGHRVQLTRNDRDDLYPAYSPDGKKIVYSGSSGSSDTEIYTINAGGGGKIQLTHNNTDEFDPAFSPDGKRIAYTGLNRKYDKSAIYTISAG